MMVIEKMDCSSATGLTSLSEKELLTKPKCVLRIFLTVALWASITNQLKLAQETKTICHSGIGEMEDMEDYGKSRDVIGAQNSY